MIKRAYTLAEVLITLTVLGLLLSIVTPTLNKNIQNQKCEAGIKKAYNRITKAVSLYMADENITNLKLSPAYHNTENLEDFVQKYFVINKNCNGKYSNPENGTKCFPDEVSTTDHTNTIILLNKDCEVSFTLNDGMAICAETSEPLVPQIDLDNLSPVNPINPGNGFLPNNGNGFLPNPGKYPNINPGNNGNLKPGQIVMIKPKLPKLNITGNRAFRFTVDVNGRKGPNVSGIDIFAMDVHPDGMIYDSTWDYIDKSRYVEYYNTHEEIMSIGKIQHDNWHIRY